MSGTRFSFRSKSKGFLRENSRFPQFKRSDCQIGNRMAVAVRCFQLHPQPGLAVVQLGAFGGVLRLVDLAVHPHVEQRHEFRFHLIVLPTQFFAVLTVVMLPGVGTGTDHIDEPLPCFVVQLDRGEQREQLPVHLSCLAPIERATLAGRSKNTRPAITPWRGHPA